MGEKKIHLNICLGGDRKTDWIGLGANSVKIYHKIHPKILAEDTSKDRKVEDSGKLSECKKWQRHDIRLYLAGRLQSEIYLFPTEFVSPVHATHTNDDQNIVGKNWCIDILFLRLNWAAIMKWRRSDLKRWKEASLAVSAAAEPMSNHYFPV